MTVVNGSSVVGSSADGVVRSNTLHNVAVLASGRIASRLFLVLSAVILPRYFGAADYGELCRWLAMLSIAMPLSTLGLPMVGLRYLPRLLSDAPAEAAVLSSTIWTTRCCLSLLAAFVAFGWAQLSGGPLVLVTALAAATLTYCLSDSASRLLVPLGGFHFLALLESSRQLLLIPAAIAGFSAAGISGVLWGFTGVNAFYAAVGLILLRTIIPVTFTKFRLSLLLQHLRFSITTFFGAIATTVWLWAPVYLVGIWAPSEQAAYLGICVQGAGAIMALVTASLQPLARDLATLPVQAGRRIGETLATPLRCVVATGVGIAVIWGLFGPELTRLILSEEFLPVYRCAMAMTIAIVFYLTGSVMSWTLFVRGRAAVAAANLCFMSFVNLMASGIAMSSGSMHSVAQHVSVGFIVSGAGFFLLSTRLVMQFERAKLPLRSIATLMLPLLPLWFLPFGEWSLAARSGVAITFALLYGWVTLTTLQKRNVS